MGAERLTCREDGIRLDAFLARQMNGYSRAFLQGLISRGCVRVDGALRDRSHRLRPGQSVAVEWPSAESAGWGRWDFKRAILFEDRDILVLNKPDGLIVHPAGISWLSRPEAALMESKPSLAGYLARFRPVILDAGVPRLGLVHRLDRETSGAIAVAKTAKSYWALTAQFRRREVLKIYRAVVVGAVREREGNLKTALDRRAGSHRVEVAGAGREAVTGYRVLQTAPRATLVEVFPRTGRTHQVRVHLSHLGHPVIGDRLYAGSRDAALKARRMMLHAHHLQLRHPLSGKEIRFTAPVPADFIREWSRIKRCR